MKVIKEKHPLVMRWTHWINFPLLTIMIWSGLLIYWANDVYQITLFGHTFVHFFPAGFYKLFNIPFRLAEGMAFHFLFMWFFFINGFLYIMYTVFSGEWRQLVPQKKSFKEAWLVVLHDLHIRKMLPPQDKYNAAQRIAYTSIIIMGIGSVATGLAIYKPVQFSTLTWLLGGYHFARILHFALTIGYILFFFIHVGQVILAGWNNFRSVVAGFEILEVPVQLVTQNSNDSNLPGQPFEHLLTGQHFDHLQDQTVDHPLPGQPIDHSLPGQNVDHPLSRESIDHPFTGQNIDHPSSDKPIDHPSPGQPSDRGQ